MDSSNQYKLFTPRLPDLYQLKAAHHNLMKGYVETLAAVSRLSFLVRLDEVRPPKKSKFSKALRNIFWGKFSMFRFFVWRPIVNLYVETHIQKNWGNYETYMFKRSIYRYLIATKAQNLDLGGWKQRKTVNN